MNLRNEATERIRKFADATLDVVIGGTALAADKAAEVMGRAREAVEDDRDTSPYEERTVEELYELAARRDIEGRSQMNKEELIFALRAER